MARRWQAVLARIGVPTGDSRIIAPGALTNRDLPLPLMWQRVSGEGHGGTVTVGAIESLTIDTENGIVLGEGRWLDVRGSDDAQRQTDAGVTGPSVDLFDDLDIVEVQKLVEAGVVGPDLMDNVDDIEYTQDDNGMIVITSARIAGATLVQIPAFSDVSIEMIPEAEANPDGVYEETTYAEPLFDETAIMSSAAPVTAPAAWFANPSLPGPMPLTVMESGQVFGHIATWGSCHVGLPGCVTPPFSPSGYAYFHQSEQMLDDGRTLPVGTLVAGPRHADAQAAFQAAMAHYDDPSAAVARVVAGEDEHGIWVAGWLIPGAKEDAVQTFRTSPVSGDWRRIGGSLEMIAVCSVNAAGFPIPKARVAFSNGHQRALIGTFGVTPVGEDHVRAPSKVTDDKSARARWAWAMTAERN